MSPSLSKPSVTVSSRELPPALADAALAQLHELPWVARLLATRGVSSAEHMDFSLSQLPRPELLVDIEAGVGRIAKALQKQQRIVVVGDYDCDGATSTALAVLALRAMGATSVDYCLPNRFIDGYGLSPAVVDRAQITEPHLLITVDNGTASVDGVEHARAYNIDVVVTDHHLPDEVLPRAAALINPRIPGATFPSVNIAGVGVIFFVMVALRSHLEKVGWFQQQGIAKPNMASYLDLVAVGTVADVVPLDHTNRVLVSQGLRRIRAAACRPGILALLEVAGSDYSQTVTETIGFRIAPRLNAAGRLEDMRHGVECLLADSSSEARQHADYLDSTNSERRRISSDMESMANGIVRDLIDKLQGEGRELISLCLYDESWHEGVIGILAGRLKERFGIPVIIFTRAKPADPSQAGVDTEIEIKGSARSIDQFHMVDALKRIRNKKPHILEKFGGHAKAAGMTFSERHFAEFQNAFDQDVRNFFSDRPPPSEILSDGQLPEDCFNLATAEMLQELAPWGQEFPAPVFQNSFAVESVRVMKDKHLKLQLRPILSSGSTGGAAKTVEAVYFNAIEAAADGSAGEIPVSVGEQIEVVFELKINSYRNRSSVQLNVIHLR